MNKERAVKGLRRIGLAGALIGATAFGAYGGDILRNSPAEGSQRNPSSQGTPRTNESGASPTPVTLEGTPTPTANTEPTLAPVEMSGCADTDGYSKSFHCEAGGLFRVFPGDVIIGDVAMADTNGGAIKILYDSDTNKKADVDHTHTGLLVDVQKEGWAYFTYGGDVLRGIENRDTWFDLKKAEMEANGCTGGCNEGVDVITWTGYDSTPDQAHFDASAPLPTPGTETPENTPDIVLPENLSELSDRELEELQTKLLYEIMKCTCAAGACPVHPEPTVTPSPTTEACPVPGGSDTYMDAGETETFTGPLTIQGDVFINGKRRFDNNANTFADHFISDTGTYRIRAPWGANVTEFCPTPEELEKMRDFHEEVTQEKLDQGRKKDPNTINR
jgi:hypothetical protein